MVPFSLFGKHMTMQNVSTFRKIIKHTGAILSISIIKLLARRRVTVVYYHRPKPSIFKRHMQWYRRRYSFVGMDDLVDSAQKDGKDVRPAFPLLVTLDDGWRENIELLLL